MSNDDRLNQVENCVDRAENQIIDLNLAVSALIELSNQTQENFTVVVNEIRSLRSDLLNMQSEIRGLQTENRRILDEMERRNQEDQE